MRNIKIFTYLKIILFLLLVFVAVYYPTNEFDVITSNLLQIKILGQIAKIISTIFNDKILLLIMVLLSVFLFWIKEAKKAIFEFIEGWYNNQRIHSTLGYITPSQKYNNYIATLAVA